MTAATQDLEVQRVFKKEIGIIVNMERSLILFSMKLFLMNVILQELIMIHFSQAGIQYLHLPTLNFLVQSIKDNSAFGIIVV